MIHAINTKKSKNDMSRILVVEDEQKMAATLEKGLTNNGHKVDIIANGLDARIADISEYDLVILDWMLPQMEGIEVLKFWRSKKYTTPVMMLTAKDTVKDRVFGLDTGADDYLGKYFEWDELLARIHALTRRNTNAEIVSKVGNIVYDRSANTFIEKDTDISLTSTETKVLGYFFDHPHSIISPTQLIRALYDHGENPYSNVIARHIKSIRSKIKYDPIKTIRGLGYRLRLM
jgi:DNA-binding response OmpR family regulator